MGLSMKKLPQIILSLLVLLAVAAPLRAADAPADFGGRPEAFAVTTIVPVITTEFQGWTLTGVTYTDASKTLTKTGAFAGYTYAVGDTILVNGGTGVTKGRYRIASKTNDDTIVLHDDIGASTADVSLVAGFEAPYALVVSAHLTTFDAATANLDVAEYSWDFGDAASTETLTDWQDSPTSTPTVNTNASAWTNHPKACHVYRTAGTYTVTLTVRIWNGSAYVTEQTTTTITVSDWIENTGDTMYFDPANSTGLADNANDGLSPTTPRLDDESQLRTHLAGNNSGRRVFFMGPSGTMTLTASIPAASGQRRQILPYTPDAQLTLTAITNISRFLHGECSNAGIGEAWADWTVEGITFDGAGVVSHCVHVRDSTNGSVGDSAGRSLRLLNCTFKRAVNNRANIGGSRMNYVVLYKPFFDGGTDPTSDLFGSGAKNVTVVGARFKTDVGNTGNTILDHFIYPSGWEDGMIAYCYGEGGHGRNFFVNGNNNTGVQQRLFITNNRISADSLINGIDLSNGSFAGTGNEPRDIIAVVVSSKTGTLAVGDTVTQKNSGATGQIKTAPVGAGTIEVLSHDSTWTNNAADLIEKTPGVDFYTPDGVTAVSILEAPLMDDVLIQRNAINGLNRGISPNTGVYVAFRDNKVWNVTHHNTVDSIYNANLDLRLYRNKRHIANGERLMLAGSLGRALWLNTGISSFFMWGEQIQDENDDNAAEYLLRHQAGTDAYSTVNHNTYWFTALTTPFRNEATTSALTFAQWQALGYDSGSTATATANPDWPDPANGDFSAAAASSGGHPAALMTSFGFGIGFFLDLGNPTHPRPDRIAPRGTGQQRRERSAGPHRTRRVRRERRSTGLRRQQQRHQTSETIEVTTR